jgi:low affinity Fe/Cu permease
MARHESQFEGAGPERLTDRFNRYASRITDALGSITALVASVVLVIVWAITGPLFNFSDTWQLFINTTTTVITFWMVFVIQSSANRDAKAIHLKLDEIIRATQGARNRLITLEAEPEEVVQKTAEELAAVAHEEVEVAEDEVAAAQTTTEADRAPGSQRGTSSEP